MTSSPKAYSLLDVAKSIDRALAPNYNKEFWVKAEINKLNHYPHSGHSYPELVEKQDQRVVAQMKAIIWKNDFNRINEKFLRMLKEPLRDGIKVLMLARISFNAVHGLSLIILDIDPSFTLGDLEREKQESIERLKKEGIYDRNKLLRMPLLPQRIAIISVETSKGYADFRRVIEGNPWGYKFFHMLFPSVLQGDKAVTGIISQLNQIRKVIHHFDVVAIIRGGGGDIGLSCYNNYSLSREIAGFPIPVISGIGHATNETVAELVSHYNAITPTKLAEMLLQKFHDFSVPVREGERIIIEQSRQLLLDEKNNFRTTINTFRSGTRNLLQQHRKEIAGLSMDVSQKSSFKCRSESAALRTLSVSLGKDARGMLERSHLALKGDQSVISLQVKYLLRTKNEFLEQAALRIPLQARGMLKKHQTELSAVEKNVFNLSPENVLKRGYSITLLNGKAMKDAAETKPGDVIRTVLLHGAIESEVKKTDKPENNE